jgi:hypothetical protein
MLFSSLLNQETEQAHAHGLNETSRSFWIWSDTNSLKKYISEINQPSEQIHATLRTHHTICSKTKYEVLKMLL